MSVRLKHGYGLVIPVLGVLALAACAAPSAPKPASPIAAIQPATYSPPPEISAPDAVPAKPAPGDLTRGADRFEGLAANDVIAALGDPNFRRREAPAEVWQYYGPGCILDLFLYDDEPRSSGKPVEGVVRDGKVAHAELRGREGAPPEANCLSRLIDLRHTQQRAG